MADASADATRSPGLRMVGVAALVGLAALVVSLEHWIAFDDAVWRGVLYLRGCETDAVTDRVVDLATRLLTGLLVVATALHMRRNGVRSAWPWVGSSVLGLLTSKTLKHLLTRERPSAIPDVALGFSFPSAHVMNSLIAMISVMALTADGPRRSWWRALAAVLTVIVSVGRVLLGRHWASDVLGGWLVALVLVGFGVPAIARRPLVAPMVLVTALGIGFVVDQRLAADGLHLPTPLVAARAAVVGVEVDRSVGRPVADRGVGSIAWLDGAATIAVDVPEGFDVSRPLALAVGGRSERALAPCLSLVFALNDVELGRFVPFRGWREYRLVLPPGVLRVGRNAFSISATTRDGPVPWALVYVRLVDRARS